MTSQNSAHIRNEDPDISRYGLPAQRGAQALANLVDEVVWYDRSAFLAASCDGVVPGLVAKLRRHHHGGQKDETESLPCVSPLKHRVAVTFAPEDDSAERPWEYDPSAALLAPERSVVAESANKITAIRLFEEADVQTPPSLVIPQHITVNPQVIVDRLGATKLVVQRAPNNLIGRGTKLVTSQAELAAVLADWPAEPLKISRYQPGLPVTVSGCVASDVTLVSSISQQLIGSPELGAQWGTHCGNQLLTEADLPVDVLQECQQATHKVGTWLRIRGFRGVFGIDAVVDKDGHVWVIEINPRFQTVVSLVHAAELAAGLFPLLGVHVLANHIPLIPLLDTRSDSAITPMLSQLVLHFKTSGRVACLPTTGCYRLDGAGALIPVPARTLTELSDDEAMVWAHAAQEDYVEAGDEAVLIQFGHRTALVSEQPQLNPSAMAWIRALFPKVDSSTGAFSR